LPPTRASGIRLGTPALTTRGMKEPEMREIGRIIADVLKNPDDESVKERARSKVRDLTEAFPLYVRYRRAMETILSGD
ncbi:MAG: serine hydroxymethyltransferase, partial [Thermotogae bacterium]|nr:serine hydroxymethyltransferase [Thermotogota bacterium]